MEQTLNTVAVGLAYTFGLGIGFFIWINWLRGHWAKQVIGKVVCEFITPEGNTYTKLQSLVGDKLIIMPKKDKPGRIYNIRDIVTSNIDYPPFMSAIKGMCTKAKKATFFEDCWEPITNRSCQVVLSPQRLFNWGQERWSAIGQAQAEEKAVQLGLKKPFGFSWQAGLIILLLIGLAALAYFFFQNQSALELFKATHGVP